MNRMELTTRPRLGENIYAANRQPLPTPWKPEVVLSPNNRRIPGSSAESATPTLAAEEAKAGEDQEEDEDFNLLADLIGF